jgi:hypothetical protein
VQACAWAPSLASSPARKRWWGCDLVLSRPRASLRVGTVTCFIAREKALVGLRSCAVTTARKLARGHRHLLHRPRESVGGAAILCCHDRAQACAWAPSLASSPAIKRWWGCDLVLSRPRASLRVGTVTCFIAREKALVGLRSCVAVAAGQRVCGHRTVTSSPAMNLITTALVGQEPTAATAACKLARLAACLHDGSEVDNGVRKGRPCCFFLFGVGRGEEGSTWKGTA